MTDLSAKDFQEPLLKALYGLANGKAGEAVKHADVYEPVCTSMGFPVDAYGQMADGKDKTVQWVQWAYKNLKRTGHVEDVGRGQWAISSAGKAEVEKMMQQTQTQQTTTPPSDGVASPVTPGQDETGYHPDPYVRALAADNTPCFGSYSHKADTCGRCPLQGPCVNFLSAELSRIAAELDREDADAAIRAARAAQQPAVAVAAATAAVAPAQADAPVDAWDWSLWDLGTSRIILSRAEGKCPRCNKPVVKGSKAKWVRSKPDGSGRTRSVMFHEACGPEK